MRHPSPSDLDEYPLVPFLVTGDHRVYYDSSALARWLDEHHPPRPGPLCPADPALGFVTQLIDEAFDELGLYLAHHNRWVLSATTNDAGRRLAREFRRVLPPGMQTVFARRFARRQVRRLPYLFSVAPAGFSIPGLPASLTPPARRGFPPTHALLAETWERYLGAMETALAARPYLLGDRFTLADASAYGAFGMNLKDPTADDRMRARAPRTHRWLGAIRDRAHVGGAGALHLSPALGPLLEVIRATFVPLMRQNAAAYAQACAAGERRFNEWAFDRDRALYDGELCGHPFRSVVKTFQVRVWREIEAAWQRLPGADRHRLPLG